jgi:DNA polymerase III alpha subunit
MIPIFRSNYSLTSILTLEKAQGKEERKQNRADSVFDICKDNDIKDVFIADNNLSGLVEAYENASAADLNLRFGYRVNVCTDMTDKSPESEKTQSKLIIFARKNSFTDLIKIHNIASGDGFHNGCSRIDYKTLKKHWNKNLIMVIPFYDSFIHSNLLYGKECVPDIDFAKPFVALEDNDLPFDHLIRNQIESSIKYDQINTKTVYYNERKDFKAYMTYRCILNRTTFQKPNLEHFGSAEFCMEAIKNAR